MSRWNGRLARRPPRKLLGITTSRHTATIAQRFEFRLWEVRHDRAGMGRGQLHGGCWDLGGVLSPEDKARGMHPADCMFPVQMDAYLGCETVDPPGLAFPVADE
jgi:hypothetical protein